MKEKILQLYYKILAQLARWYIRKHNPYIIGINGSVGKTSCRHIIAQTLRTFLPRPYKVYTSPENFNGELGMSLSIFKVDKISPSATSFLYVLYVCMWRRFFGYKPYDCIVLEYGIDRPKEMEFLLSIVKPHIGIFTKIDSVHSDKFGTPQAIAQEEAKMIQQTREIAFLNTDDTYARQLYSMITIDKFFYQTIPTKEVKPDVFYSEDHLTENEKHIAWSEFLLHNKEYTLPIHTNLIGKENYGYIAVAFSILDILRFQRTHESFFASENIRALLENQTGKKHKKTPDYIGRTKSKDTHLDVQYTLLPGRLSLFHGIKKSIIIDSSYNASPLSVRKVVETTYSLQKELFPQRKVLMVFGDMRELGDFEEKEHRLVAGILHMTADKIVLVGDATQTYTQDELCKIWYTKDCIHCCSHAHAAGAYVQDFLYKSKDHRIVLIKGSQNTIFLEEAVKYLLNKETYARHEHFHFLTRQSKHRMRIKRAFFKKWI
jgi:UDP-N-acetylmuramoyl-tripeptide--D-alanyl-D-alanine ligase